MENFLPLVVGTISLLLFLPLFRKFFDKFKIRSQPQAYALLAIGILEISLSIAGQFLVIDSLHTGEFHCSRKLCRGVIHADTEPLRFLIYLNIQTVIASFLGATGIWLTRFAWRNRNLQT